MAAGTGEAPCQVLPYRGRLWVTSWGDYRIEAYTLRQLGASCQAQAEIIVQGDSRFRPVGLAVAPDESLYFSDWVDRSYPVHGQGRIWRLIPANLREDDAAFPPLSPAEIQAAQLRHETNVEVLLAAAQDNDPFVRQAASYGLGAAGLADDLSLRQLTSPRQRVLLLEAIRWRRPRTALRLVDDALSDDDDEVVIYALRLIAEQQSQAHRRADRRTLATSASAQCTTGCSGDCNLKLVRCGQRIKRSHGVAQSIG